MPRRSIRSVLSQLISLPAALAMALGASIAYALTQNVFPNAKWPWVGGILFWLTFSIPLYAIGLGWIRRISRTGSGLGEETPPADYRDLVTLWIVATILALGWIGISFRAV